MKFESKFNIGDRVFNIVNYPEVTYLDCPTCEGRKAITVGNETFTCPKCHGRGGFSKRGENKWIVKDGSLAIGQIRIVHGPKPEESYMCLETGVGSGNVYYAKDLFTSRQEAVDECWERNAAVVVPDSPLKES